MNKDYVLVKVPSLIGTPFLAIKKAENDELVHEYYVAYHLETGAIRIYDSILDKIYSDKNGKEYTLFTCCKYFLSKNNKNSLCSYIVLTDNGFEQVSQDDYILSLLNNTEFLTDIPEDRESPITLLVPEEQLYEVKNVEM